MPISSGSNQSAERVRFVLRSLLGRITIAQSDFPVFVIFSDFNFLERNLLRLRIAYKLLEVRRSRPPGIP
jgi:hypothetical protein